MRLWWRYVKEKRRVLLLCFLTIFVFLAVGTLYHIENLEKLLYAALLVLVLWGAAGIRQGMRYVAKSKKLEREVRLLEQNGEAVFEYAETFEEDCKKLFSLMEEEKRREHSFWEEQAAERQDYYLMWAHQIKTPISAMKLLLEGEGRQDKESFLMREELFKIEQYVEMVLSFQRLENMSGDLELNEYALAPLLKQAVKKYAILFINRKVQLELSETAACILTDEKWFLFCVEQVLSNSIKYTGQGKIRIACEEEEESVILTISDTGIGIRAEDLPRIFEKGFTGYNGRMDKKATGIGLYLSKRICDRLGIGLEVESETARGTIVRFVIPKKEKNGCCNI